MTPTKKISEVPNIVDLGVKKWPSVNYGNHPAYGGTFNRPGISRRINAVKTLAPFILRQLKLSLRRSERWNRPEPTSEHGSVFEALTTDGIIGLKMADDDHSKLNSLVAPAIKGVQTRKADIAPGERKFLDSLYFLTREEHGAIYELIDQTLDNAGIKAAASRYANRPLSITMVNLMVYDADESHWRNMFDDTDVVDPPTTYWHMDSSPRNVKIIMYLNEVDEKNGPFSYVKGSHRLHFGGIEYWIRKANDKSRMDKTDRETRELFHGLPGFLQKKCEFGNDLDGEHPDVQHLLAAEANVTTADGHIILFDTDGIHRGGMVKEGERYVLQVLLGPN